MKKILVAVDFSEASRAASEYAATLAKAFGAEIYLLHVFLETAPATEAPIAWRLSSADLDQEKDERVKEEIDFLRLRHKVNVTGYARIGYKSNTINELARNLPADLVVVGMKKDAAENIFRSTVITTVRKIKTPVLIVPEGIVFSPIKHVVLAEDFNEVRDESCYNLLFDLLDRFDASLEVLHVEKRGAEKSSPDTPGRLQLGKVLSKVSFLYEEVENDDVDNGIQEFVGSHPADLLVMIAHQHTMIERMMEEDFVKEMAYKTRLPLLVLEDKRSR